MPTRRISGTATAASDPDNGGDHSGGGSGGTFVDDVFSTYLYEGTGAERDIVNGIDLDGEGGMVWQKYRNQSYSHLLFDTERGIRESDSAGWMLSSNTTDKETAADALRSFNSDGFTTMMNAGNEMVSWTFRKQPKFFDCVTYTGDQEVGCEIPHNLGSVPGMMIIKRTDQDRGWVVYHQSIGNDNSLVLDRDIKAYSSALFNYTTPTDKVFSINDDYNVNAMFGKYVAYLFAHDDSDEGLIQCGSYTGTGAAGNEIDLGWEPQWLMIKNASSAAGWVMYDTMRGFGANDIQRLLYADTSAAEGDSGSVSLSSTGFDAGGGQSAAWVASNKVNDEYIYMAIRRPNKPASEFEPEELFAIDAGTGAGTTNEPNFPSGFPVDFTLFTAPAQTSGRNTFSRLTGANTLDAHSANAEYANAPDYSMQSNNGFYVGGQTSGFQSWMWRRQTGFFDVVTYEGNGVAGREVPHNLGVAPEMMWVKSRDIAGYWQVYSKATGNTHRMHLNSDGQKQVTDRWANTDPTSDVFTVGLTQDVNANANDYIAYLFASVPGICDIGTYTANGNDLDIDCGFTNGARFVLIKRTDDAGAWWVFDTLRGITSSSSPRLNLNDTSAQSVGNYIEPFSKGFTVTTNIMPIGTGQYIYMAIA